MWRCFDCNVCRVCSPDQLGTCAALSSVCQGLCSVPLVCSPRCPSVRLANASLAALGRSCARRQAQADQSVHLWAVAEKLLWGPQALMGRCVVWAANGPPNLSSSVSLMTVTHDMLAQGSPASATHKPQKSCMHVVLGTGLVGMAVLEIQGATSPPTWGGHPSQQSLHLYMSENTPAAPALWATWGGGQVGFTAILQARV